MGKKKKQKNPTLIKEDDLILRGPLWIMVTFFLFWITFVLTNYFKRFPVNFDGWATVFSAQNLGLLFSSKAISRLPVNLLYIVLLGWIVFICFGLGYQLLQWFKLKLNSRLEVISLSCGFGFGILSYIIFFIGLAGLLYGKFIYPLLFCLTILAVFKLRNLFLSYPKVPAALAKKKWTFFEKFLIVILSITILINFIQSLTPEIFYDSLVYHLAAPQFYLLNHKILPLPYNLYSNIPALTEMLYLLGIFLKDEILAKLINFALGINILFLIYSFAKRYFNRLVGILAIAIFYTTPILILNSWVSGVEIGMSVFVLLSIYSLVNWFKYKQKEWLILSGIGCGLAMGTKYTGIYFLIAIFIILLILKLKNKEKRYIDFAYFLIPAFLFILPWLIKNFVFTGNPVFPYLYNIFDGKNLIPSNINKFINETREYNISFFQYFIHPWELTMKGNTIASFIGPIFLLFTPIFIFFKKLKYPLKILIGFLIISWFVWSLTTRMLRFFIPALSVFSILIGEFVYSGKYNSLLKNLFCLILAILFVFQIGYILPIFHNLEGWKVVYGLESKDEYLTKEHLMYPNPYYATINWANKNIEKNSNILFFGEPRGYYSKKLFITNTVFDLSPLIELIKESNNADELYLKLNEEKITHILINFQEAVRLEPQYNIFYWNQEEMKIFHDFWDKYVKEIYSENGVYLFEVLPPEEVAPQQELTYNIMGDFYYNLSYHYYLQKNLDKCLENIENALIFDPQNKQYRNIYYQLTKGL